MEAEEKSKKVAKEKRSTKKSKAVALPAKEIPAALEAKPAPTAATKTRSTAKEPARSVARPPKIKEPTFKEIQLQAYYIGERRKKYGIPGDETSDWVEAELTLKAQFVK